MELPPEFPLSPEGLPPAPCTKKDKQSIQKQKTSRLKVIPIINKTDSIFLPSVIYLKQIPCHNAARSWRVCQYKKQLADFAQLRI